MLQTPLVFLGEGNVVRILRKLTIGPCDIGFDTASDDSHYADTEGRELDAEGVAVLVQSSL